MKMFFRLMLLIMFTSIIIKTDVFSQNIIAGKVNTPGWTTMFLDDFESGLSSRWLIKTQAGSADAKWGLVTITSNHAVWCAASGTQSSQLGNGYVDNMNTWMTAGPFDLSDATDAKVEFSYWLNCEMDYDYLWCAASENNDKYVGVSFTDSAFTSDFKSYTFSLKNYAGKTNVYFGFMFISDSLVSEYGGALIDNVALKKFVYPAQISVNNTFTFNDASKSSSYRLIGLPGSPSLPISATLTGQSKKDWRAFLDNGAAANYLTEFDGSTNFNFSQGNAFWVLSKNAANINLQVPAAAYSTDYTVNVPLHSGWNIITCPLAETVLWEAVKQANSLPANQVIYGFDGQWSTKGMMEPYTGYYFNNSSGLAALKIPLIQTSGKTVSAQPDTSGLVRLAIVRKGYEVSKAFAGISPKAKEGFDYMDYIAPPSDFEDVKITLSESENSSRNNRYFIECKPSNGGAAIFNIDIKNISGEDIALKVNGLPANSKSRIYLLSSNSALLQDFALNDSFIISGESERSFLKLLIGGYEAADSIVKIQKPAEFALAQNYPNPFNSAAVIGYSIEKPGIYELAVFNALGARVAELFSKYHDAGTYRINFSTGDMPSGIYFYRLSGGGNTTLRKMVILK